MSQIIFGLALAASICIPAILTSNSTCFLDRECPDGEFCCGLICAETSCYEPDNSFVLIVLLIISGAALLIAITCAVAVWLDIKARKGKVGQASYPLGSTSNNGSTTRTPAPVASSSAGRAATTNAGPSGSSGSSQPIPQFGSGPPQLNRGKVRPPDHPSPFPQAPPPSYDESENDPHSRVG